MAEEKKRKKDVFKKLSKNYWAVATIVLAILLVISIALSHEPNVSPAYAGQAVVNFATAQGLSASLISVEDQGGLYLVTLNIDGEEVPVYTTIDGKNLIPSVVPLTATQTTQTQQTQTTEVTKSETPKAELFIWSYCPYGVTALTPFAQVAKLLGNSANFEVQTYYDGHGAYETQQNKIQSCIQKYDSSKYWDYAISFASDIYPVCGASRDIDCDEAESTALMKSLGIDSAKIMQCVEDEGEALIGAASQRASSLGVTGSPTLVINDAKVNAARNAEAYKQSVCSAFITAPSDCDEALSSAGATASGSC